MSTPAPPLTWNGDSSNVSIRDLPETTLGDGDVASLYANRRSDSTRSSGSRRTFSVWKPPPNIKAKKHNNVRLRKIVKQLQNISDEGFFVLLLAWLLIGTFILYNAERRNEQVYEKDLLSIHEKCENSKDANGTDIIERAIRQLNLTEGENSTLFDLGNIPFRTNFCETLFYYKSVENKTDPNRNNNFFYRWDFPSTMFFMMSAFTTVGYGNLTPGTRTGQGITVLFCIFGIPLTGLLLYRSATRMSKIALWWAHILEKRCNPFESRASKEQRKEKEIRKAKEKIEMKRMFDRQGLSKSQQKIERRRVKRDKHKVTNISDVTLFQIMGLLCFLFGFFGALVCQRVFQWSLIDSMWFMFVSMTTVGFGDKIPNWRECFLTPPHFHWKAIYLATLIFYIFGGVSCLLTVLQSGGQILFEAIIDEKSEKAQKAKTTDIEEEGSAGDASEGGGGGGREGDLEFSRDEEQRGDEKNDSNDQDDEFSFSHENPMRGGRL